VNRYSARWFRTFLETVPAARTDAEVAFLTRNLPRNTHPTVLDLCCGPGRHALPLAGKGYEVTGVDRDAAAIARARAAGVPGTRFVEADVLDFEAFAGTWHAVIVMWASFGFFDEDQNRRLLAEVSRRLRPAGRVVLDLFNPDFFRERQGSSHSDRGGPGVVESRRIEGGRLEVEIRYGDGEQDLMSWQMFRAENLASLASSARLDLVLACSDFDEATPVDAARPRMQLVLERRE
jgi:SAM-dependent methyltransferase